MDFAMNEDQIIISINEDKGTIESKNLTNDNNINLEYKTFEKTKYEIYSTNKIFKRINRQPKNRHQDIIKVLSSVSENPLGKNLPKK
jgi:hypothetical protein